MSEWKLWALGSGGLLAIAATLINRAAEDYYQKVAKEKAAADIPADILNEIEEAKKTLKIGEEVRNREHKEIYEGVRKWKRENDYDRQIGKIHADAMVELSEFKRSIDYYDRKQNIEDDYEDQIETFKDSIDYDYELSLQEAKIEDAKALYSKRCRKIDSASSGDSEISDALSDVKKAEKEKLEDTVKDAKSEISKLKSKLQNEENRLGRKKQQELRELENELVATKARLNKQEADACGVLDAKKNEAEQKIRESVVAKRTNEETAAIERGDECIRFLDDRKDIDEKNAWLLNEKANASEKWAEYLKSEGVPKWLVVFVGALPLIPVGWCVTKYVKFIMNIVRAM